MSKIVVLADKTGDLGNRLFRFARFYNSKPNGVWLVDLSLYQFVYLFSPKAITTRLGFCLLRLLDNKRYAHLVFWLSHRSWVAEIDVPKDLQSDALLSEFYVLVERCRNWVVLVRGNTLYLQTTEDKPDTISRLRNTFRLKHKHRRKAERKLAPARAAGPLVGVHIRRRDYRTFVGGKFFFEDDVYRAVISRLRDEWAGAGTPKFILVSEEAVETKNYPSCCVEFFGPGTVSFDQALLAACDFLIGPPSTFSGWVSFLHEIPRAEIREADQRLSWSDFKETVCDYISIDGSGRAVQHFSENDKQSIQHLR